MENTEEYAFSSGTKQQSYLEGFSTNNSALIGVGSAGESGQESTDKNPYRNQGQLITGEYVCQDLYIQDVANITQNQHQKNKNPILMMKNESQQNRKKQAMAKPRARTNLRGGGPPGVTQLN